MIYKILALLLMTLSLHSKAIDLNSLERLNYQLIKSLNPLDEEPYKVYRFSLPKKIEPSKGIFIIKRIDQSFSEFLVFIDDKGIIRTDDKVKEQVLAFDGGYTESFEVLFATIDENNEPSPVANCTITPFPRAAKDAQGHLIEISAASDELFNVNGSGFAPNEKISFHSRSCHESITHTFEADEKGCFFFVTAPAVVGKKEGPFELTFTGKDMEPLKVRHYWGTIAFSKISEYRNLKSKYKFPEE